MSAVSDIAASELYVRRELAKAEAAIVREADDTLAALREALGGELPDPLPFSHAHIRALVRSAFLAGVNYECGRR